MYWQALSTLGEDFTVFVHLTDADGHILAQADSRPRGGAYPTLLWDRNEAVEDEHMLIVPGDLAPGSYQIRVGLYQLRTMQRLPALGPDGHRLADDEVLLGAANER